MPRGRARRNGSGGTGAQTNATTAEAVPQRKVSPDPDPSPDPDRVTATGAAASPRRRRSILFRVTALLLVPLLSLIALWGFAASITMNSALQKVALSTTYKDIGLPSGGLHSELQQERALTVIYLAGRGKNRSDLLTQRARTDALEAAFRRSALSRKAQDAADALVRERVDDLTTELARLAEVRAEVDTGRIGAFAVIDSYSRMVDSTIRLFGGLVILNDLDIYRQGRAMISLTMSRESMLREDALITAAQMRGGLMTAQERAAVLGLIAAGRQSFDMGMADLTGELRARVQEFADSADYRQLRRMEDAIAAAKGDRLPADAAPWTRVTVQISGTWALAINFVSTSLANQAKPISDRITVRLVVAGGLGLVAVLLSVLMSVLFVRGLARELRDLRGAARNLAETRLPRVVARLRRGEDVDVRYEAPPLSAGRTKEVAQVADAFTQVQRTAVESAVGEARLRKGISQVFLNIAWRSQSLLHRQLRMLDTMEQRATDPEALDDLFRLDHLTTRMRRHAEGLAILSGAVPARGWSRPVLVEDVLRAAASEVEDYTRVEAVTTSRVFLAGSVVTDVVHLLAELIENATVFSPPQTEVTVRGELVGNGFAVEVVDRGIGIDPHERAALNDRLARPPEFDLADSDRLGLFVVASLAGRYGIRVSLQESPYGGTTAVVLLPHEMVADENALDGPSETGVPIMSAVGPEPAPGGAGTGSDGNGGFWRPRHEGNGSGPGGQAGAGNGTSWGATSRGRPAGPGSPMGHPPAPVGGLIAVKGGRDTGEDGYGQAGGPAAGNGGLRSVTHESPPSGSNGGQGVRAVPSGDRPPLREWFEPPGSPRRRPEAPGTAEPDPVVPGLVSPERPPGFQLSWTGAGEPATAGRPRLPRRDRQASLAPQLRAAPAVDDAGDPGAGARGAAAEETAGAAGVTGPSEAPQRSPEESRALMDALQAGWSRGRDQDGADAEAEMEDDPETGAGADTGADTGIGFSWSRGDRGTR